MSMHGTSQWIRTALSCESPVAVLSITVSNGQYVTHSMKGTVAPRRADGPFLCDCMRTLTVQRGHGYTLMRIGYTRPLGHSATDCIDLSQHLGQNSTHCTTVMQWNFSNFGHFDGLEGLGLSIIITRLCTFHRQRESLSLFCLDITTKMALRKRPSAESWLRPTI